MSSAISEKVKLQRFLISRGFENDIIVQALKKWQEVGP